MSSSSQTASQFTSPPLSPNIISTRGGSTRGSTRGSKRGSTAASESEQIPTFEFSRVTQEDRFLAMMGYKDLNKEYGPGGLIFYREEFCGACGIIHSNPEVLDTYINCESCHSVIREPSILRNRFKLIKEMFPLDILFATYGDPFDPSTAIDVTQKCTQRLKLFPSCDRIAFKPTDRLNDIFDCDPCPGKNSQLRIRYRMNGIHGTLILDFNREHRIPSPFLLLVPKKRYLKILSANYGHPKGRTRTGRMSYDVTEIMQSLVDQNGGSYLNISSYIPIARMLGDPCPGYIKDLRIQFEVVGRAGEILYSEIRGHLTKKLYILSSPTVAPLIFVVSAFYGVTPTGRRDRLDYLAKELRKIEYIEHRQREGLPIQAEDVALIKKKAHFLRQREIFRKAEIKFVEVSIKLQKLADEGCTVLKLDKSSFDPNSVFGNPYPGMPKIFECQLDCQGHDSERNTESNEMTETGYARNFITMKKARFNILVEEDMEGRGVLEETLDFSVDYAAPIVIITRASYGELHDLNKVIDVTNEIQKRVVGRSLIIGREINLNKLFRLDPSPGRRKQLRINYITRGFTGFLRVREKNDTLVAGIELGYPPVPPPDDDNFKEG